MFRERLIDVARRKERLLARCEGQRLVVAETYRRWQAPAHIFDRAWAAVGFLRLHPAVLVVAVAAVVVLGRRNLFAWAGRGLVAWRAWRMLAGWLRRFNA